MTEQKIINGLDANKLLEMTNAVEEKPSLANFRFRIINTWMNGGHSRSVIKGFYGADEEDSTRTFPFIFDIDQPLSLLGESRGPTPIEYMLNALAGCLTNSIVYNAAAKGIPVEDVESELEGNFDLQHFFGIHKIKNKGVGDIKVRLRISGKNLTSEQKKSLCELGKKSSLVYKIITNSLPVTVSTRNELYDD